MLQYFGFIAWSLVVRFCIPLIHHRIHRVLLLQLLRQFLLLLQHRLTLLLLLLQLLLLAL